MEAAPDVADKLMTDNIQAYIDVLKDVKEEKPAVTENGQKILQYLQENPDVRKRTSTEGQTLCTGGPGLHSSMYWLPMRFTVMCLPPGAMQM